MNASDRWALNANTTKPLEPAVTTPETNAGVDRRNLMQALAAHASERPDAVALQLGERIYSQAQLHAAVVRAATYLRAQGVQPGATVALYLSDLPALAVGLLALMRLGATPMPLAPTATPLQVQESVTDGGAHGVLAAPGTEMPLTCAVWRFSEALFDAPALPGQDAPCVDTPDAPCLLVTGSGTTGKPRLMAITHAQMRARLVMQQTRYAVTSADRLMVVTPLHFSVSVHNMLAALFAGATSVVWDQQGSLARSVAAARPDVLSLTMVHAEQLLHLHSQDASVDLSAIRVVTLTSSTISEALRQRLRRELNARLHVVYGTNEVYSVTVAYPQDMDELAGGVGRADHGVTVQLVDREDRLVAHGDVGELRVKTPAQIDGYVNATDTERFRGGWFYPGDLGRWAPGGQLLLMGRSDEMMIMKGVNIYPAEIELALREHPAVRDVAAFAFHHPVAQELPVCVVALHAGERCSRRELMAFARERLGAKAPRTLAITDQVPRSPQGKPLRAELSALIERALSRDLPPSAERAQAFIRQRDEQRRAAGAAGSTNQRRRRVALDLVLPAWPRTEALGVWRGLLDGQPAPPPGDAGALDVEISHEAVIWVCEVMRVLEALLRAARAPFFDTCRLLSCKPRPDTLNSADTGWRVEMEVPWLEGLPTELVSVAFKAALGLAAWAREHPDLSAGSAAGKEAFFAWVDAHALAPLRKLVPGGKSTVHVLRAAFDRGVPFAHLGGGIYQLGWGSQARRFNRSSTEQDAAMGISLTHRKDLAARLLRCAGLPGAEHELVTTLEAARAAAARMGWPLVVKPADADRGEGVQVDVDSDGLEAAFAHAKKHSPSRRVLIERQIPGTCHRIFVAGGQLLYAVKRLPAGVTGDGEHTVAALVEAGATAQRLLPPWQRAPTPSLDAQATASLARQGLDAQAVVPAGRFVALRRIESTALGGVDEDVTITLHPENLRIALAAAALCGLDVAGVDLISTDITQPWHTNAAAINEVNFSPLLGEGAISRRHVPTFLNRLLGGNGRIPVEVFVGQEAAVSAARQRAAELRATGLATALTTHAWTETPEGQPWAMTVDGLHARIRALVLSPSVGALVIVVQTDELLNRELPLEGVNAVHGVEGAPALCPIQLPGDRRHRLLEKLRNWVVTGTE